MYVFLVDFNETHKRATSVRVVSTKFRAENSAVCQKTKVSVLEKRTYLGHCGDSRPSPPKLKGVLMAGRPELGLEPKVVDFHCVLFFSV